MLALFSRHLLRAVESLYLEAQRHSLLKLVLQSLGRVSRPSSEDSINRCPHDRWRVTRYSLMNV